MRKEKRCTNCGHPLVEGCGIPYKTNRWVCDKICRDERDRIEEEIAVIQREEKQLKRKK
jgi:hypothetical protein